MLEDGTYDVIIVDASTDPEQGEVLHLELTVLAGVHKGEVVPIQASGTGLEDVEALGCPGTVEVLGGVRSLSIES